MEGMIKVAAVQMVSSANLEQNFGTAQRLIAEAAERGAEMVLLPEYWAFMGMRETDKVSLAESPQGGPIQQFMAEIAREKKIWLIGGTMPIAAPATGKVLNSMLAYNPDGLMVSRYDKIHLFGFTKDDESYDESATIVPGRDVTVLCAPFGEIGLSVCYDLRFPELYRAMGPCTMIVVPAAFTYTTGKAHWEILLRARAIENQCYVLAAAQGGKHENGRRTWGHSMLIDPWGEIKALLPEGEGVIVGDIDSQMLEQVRQNLPALKHRKL